MDCKYYTREEISNDFPLEKCGSCQNNMQDLDDGLYTCKLILNEVYSKSDVKGE